jgi:hypothetical protein
MSTAVRVAARGLRRPWVGVLAAALALAPTLWAFWAPIAISTRHGHFGGVFYELAFISGLLGALLGLRLADEWAWLTDRWNPGERLRFEALLMAVPLAVLVSIPAAWLLATPQERDPLVAAAVLLTLARPVAVGLVLRRLPLTPVARALALLALCWWIPAIAPPSFLGLGPVSDLASRPGGPGTLATPRPWLAETTMLLALLLAARLGLGSAKRRS